MVAGSVFKIFLSLLRRTYMGMREEGLSGGGGKKAFCTMILVCPCVAQSPRRCGPDIGPDNDSPSLLSSSSSSSLYPEERLKRLRRNFGR